MPIPTHYVTKDKEVTNKLRHSLTNYSGYFATDVCVISNIVSNNSVEKLKSVETNEATQ